MKKYEFKRDLAGKSLKVKLRGQFNKEEGTEYIDEFKKQMNFIFNRKEYSLSLDCNEMKITASDTTEALEYCLNLYAKAGFKEVEIITKDNPSKAFLDMQFTRLGKKAGLDFKLI